MTEPANQSPADPADLSIDELRRERSELQTADDAVSYVRRVAQARLDLVRAEAARRSGEPPADTLRDVLSSHLTSSAPRPPRPTDVVDDHPLIDELDEIAAEHGFSRVDELDANELAGLDRALSAFERRVSDDRRARYDRLDALSAELVRRYRDGEASVDQLLAEDGA